MTFRILIETPGTSEPSDPRNSLTSTSDFFGFEYNTTSGGGRRVRSGRVPHRTIKSDAAGHLLVRTFDHNIIRHFCVKRELNKYDKQNRVFGTKKSQNTYSQDL